MPKRLTRSALAISWCLQAIAAIILVQTLAFKFTGAEESRYIFRTLDLEPAGRIGTGIVELIAVVLLLVPRTIVCGAVLAVGVISGAIAGHLTKLGIAVQGDGGLLFALAITVLLACTGVLAIRRNQIPFLGSWLSARTVAAKSNPPRTSQIGA